MEATAESKDLIIRKIEEIFLHVTRQILNDQLPVITSNVENRSCFHDSMNESEFKEINIKFSYRKSVTKFGITMKLLAFIHNLLTKNIYCTKRDLYYQNPALYGSQRYVDGLIDNIAAMLAVPRWHLHILATSKGVIAGDIVYADHEGKVVDCSRSPGGVLLPSHMHKISLIRSQARFVLIVEKDATFQHLIEEKFTEKMGPCIIITAKGYPDLNTRQILNMISVKFPEMPIYALVDSDPHGVSIYLTYKHGSQVHSHGSSYLLVPGLKWLGILPSEIKSLQLDDQAMITLTTNDRAHIQDILNRYYMKHEVAERKELLTMLETNTKCEIQALDKFGRGFLTDVYLPYKLRDARPIS